MRTKWHPHREMGRGSGQPNFGGKKPVAAAERERERGES